jgi:Na+-translocating ferredoxin:NAD+ oxidoreductase RnfG subunit
MSDQNSVNVKAQFLGAIIVLGGICLASGLGMALVYSGLRESIEEKKQEALAKRLAVVLGEQEEYPQLDVPADTRVYYARQNGQVLLATTGKAQGYQSTINVLVSVTVPAEGFDPAEAATWPEIDDQTPVHRIAVVSSGETPGLGERINEVSKDISIWGRLRGETEPPGKRAAFQQEFDNVAWAEMKLSVNGGEVDALTGATITSKATVAAVRNALASLQKALKTREPARGGAQ